MKRRTTVSQRYVRCQALHEGFGIIGQALKPSCSECKVRDRKTVHRLTAAVPSPMDERLQYGNLTFGVRGCAV